MNFEHLRSALATMWEQEVLPTLAQYIRIPCKSPDFDPDWAAHGHMDRAVELLVDWARTRLTALRDASVEVIRLPGRTPVILIDVPGQSEETILLYGHLDKQPEMEGWSEGLGPWQPVRRGDLLYGRGAADDGYAMFAALTAVIALRELRVPHARYVLLIEGSEESGSADLPYYIEHLADRIRTPCLVVCLDSGCGSYDRLWLTTSLRGLATGILTVRVLEEGVHSGDASGIVPSSFRIARQLLSRLEDEVSGEILLPELSVQIPEERIEQATEASHVLGRAWISRFPWRGTTQSISNELPKLIVNRTWRPQLSVTGAAGLPNPQNAGSVLLPYTKLKLSFRLPPTVGAKRAGELIRATLQRSPPHSAEVLFELEHAMSGWNAPRQAPWLNASVAKASQLAFGQPPGYMGEGGAIPFMGMLARKFPEAQFVVTGVLGPRSNAHGPNEFLHVPAAIGISAAVAQIIADQFEVQGTDR
jgi:acetylornithine deacetylase/succinyl-diaminopimelate desuccinylase-like protein